MPEISLKDCYVNGKRPKKFVVVDFLFVFGGVHF